MKLLRNNYKLLKIEDFLELSTTKAKKQKPKRQLLRLAYCPLFSPVFAFNPPKNLHFLNAGFELWRAIDRIGGGDGDRASPFQPF
jgi:hypothetical protein